MRTIGRHIASILTVLLAVALFHSCAKDEDIETVVGDGEARLSLVFSTGEMSLTRAITQVAGVEDYNENVIHRLDVFFYPLAGTLEDQEAKAAVLHLSYDNLDKQSTYEITDYIVSKGTLNTLGLKDDKDECYVYVVANAPSSITTFDDDSTIAEVKAKKIEATTFPASDWDTRKQKEFVMTGEGKATYASATTKLSGNIELKRVAAKIEFRVTNVEKEIKDEGDNLWVSFPDDMRIQFNDGVKATNIGGTQTVASTDYFATANSTTGNTEYITMKKESNGTSYFHEYPFYSYPSNWDTGSDEEAYATLIVPWRRVEKDAAGNPKKDDAGNYVLTGKYLNTYYQIPIGESAKGIVSNAYYKMGISVGIIGSIDPDEPITLENNSYIIVDWTTGELLPIAMKKVNYLAVASNEVTISNKESGEVAYVSSQDVTVKVKKVTFWDYTYKYDGNDSDNNKAGADEPYQVTLDETNTSYKYPHRTNTTVKISDFTVDTTTKEGYLTLTHKLGSSDYVPYTVEVEISNGTLTETVTFTQYPPIYIEGNLSTIPLWVNNGQRDYDGNPRSSGSWQHVETRSDVDGSGKNNTRYLFAIHVSSLGNSYTYSISDVRDEEADQSLYNSLSGYGKYRPTKESNEAQNMIAPAYLIASSYGKTYSTYFDTQKKRCASYQEDGYPAGRWRVPTEAEIQFAIDLSANGIIPKLFDGSYFASSGRYYDSKNKAFSNANNGTYSVRCVYDLWYWGTEHSATSYTWGDN